LFDIAESIGGQSHSGDLFSRESFITQYVLENQEQKKRLLFIGGNAIQWNRTKFDFMGTIGN